MKQIDALLSHVWMVRAFLKHCEEAEEDANPNLYPVVGSRGVPANTLPRREDTPASE